MKIKSICSLSVVSAVLFFSFIAQVYAMDVTLEWDANIDPHLISYEFYYNTASGPPYNPVCMDYVNVEYSIDGGTTWNAVDCPPPIVVAAGITEIEFRGLDDDRNYYFSLRALNSEGLQSLFSREVCALGSSSSAPYDKGWAITDGDLKGFKIFYNNTAPSNPTLGSPEDVPPIRESISGIDGVGLPINLQPSGTSFASPDYVKLIIPCPGHTNPSGLDLYLYDDLGGAGWVLAWDGSQQAMTTAGRDWLAAPPVPNNSDPVTNMPATLEVQVKHFSGVQAAVPVGFAPEGSGGGGCFISTIGHGY